MIFLNKSSESTEVPGKNVDGDLISDLSDIIISSERDSESDTQHQLSVVDATACM